MGANQMIKQRRQWLSAAGSLFAAVGLLPLRSIAQTVQALDIRAVDLTGSLSQAKFKALLNQTFYIRDETLGTVFARLVAVRSVDGPINPEQFSIFFQAPPVPALHAGVYEVEHYLAGKSALYLEPVPGPGTALRYRADFSLLH
jgi:uncharacterized protein DUF6916